MRGRPPRARDGAEDPRRGRVRRARRPPRYAVPDARAPPPRMVSQTGALARERRGSPALLRRPGPLPRGGVAGALARTVRLPHAEARTGDAGARLLDESSPRGDFASPRFLREPPPRVASARLQRTDRPHR